MELSENETNSQIWITKDDVIDYLNQKEITLLIPVITFKCIVIVIGVFGNAHVCYIYRPKAGISSTRFFIFFLGVTDLITCGLLAPLETAFLEHQYNFDNKYLCSSFGVVIIWVTLCMAFVHVALTIERYRRVCKSEDWQVTLRQAKIVCIVVVIVSLFCSIGLPVFTGSSIRRSVLKEYNVTITRCTNQDSINAGTNSLKFWYNVAAGTLFIGGLVVIIVLNCMIGARILYKIRIKRRPLDGDIRDNQRRLVHSKKMRCEKIVWERFMKISVSMMLVSMTFVLSFLPILVLILIRSIKEDFETNLSDTGKVVYRLFLNSHLLNNAINPFIYLIYDGRFREKSKTLLPGLCMACINKLNK